MSMIAIERILPHPDDIGASEYREIYDLVEDAVDLEHAIGIADAFADHANWIKEQCQEALKLQEDS